MDGIGVLGKEAIGNENIINWNKVPRKLKLVYMVNFWKTKECKYATQKNA